jgi:hypothetical protein
VFEYLFRKPRVEISFWRPAVLTTFAVFLLSTSEKMPVQYLQWSQERFHILSNSLFTNCPTDHRYIILATARSENEQE